MAGKGIQQAKAVCASCPVWRPCLVYALTTRQEFGIWGGWDENERRLLHRQWRARRRRPGPARLPARGLEGSAAKAGSNVEIGQCLGLVALMHDKGAGPLMSRRFAYAIDKRYLPLLVPFGLRSSQDGVTLTEDGSLLATFGFFKIKTPLANVTEAHITRNYRWWTAFGVRGSMVDDGLSFGTNHDAGVCIHFAEKVPSPLRRSGHSALTVTVADLEGLTNALTAGDGEASSASPT
jgi:hypothetical protein